VKKWQEQINSKYACDPSSRDVKVEKQLSRKQQRHVLGKLRKKPKEGRKESKLAFFIF